MVLSSEVTASIPSLAQGVEIVYLPSLTKWLREKAKSLQQLAKPLVMPGRPAWQSRFCPIQPLRHLLQLRHDLADRDIFAL